MTITAQQEEEGRHHQHQQHRRRIVIRLRPSHFGYLSLAGRRHDGCFKELLLMVLVVEVDR
jgi:hypothetical protein